MSLTGARLRRGRPLRYRGWPDLECGSSWFWLLTSTLFSRLPSTPPWSQLSCPLPTHRPERCRHWHRGIGRRAKRGLREQMPVSCTTSPPCTTIAARVDTALRDDLGLADALGNARRLRASISAADPAPSKRATLPPARHPAALRLRTTRPRQTLATPGPGSTCRMGLN